MFYTIIEKVEEGGGGGCNYTRQLSQLSNPLIKTD